MILTEYSSSRYSKSLVCFLIFSHSAFDVGRSMFDVLFFSEPSTVSRRKNKLALMGINPAIHGNGIRLAERRTAGSGRLRRPAAGLNPACGVEAEGEDSNPEPLNGSSYFIYPISL
jgi:hypothetical protein